MKENPYENIEEITWMPCYKDGTPMPDEEFQKILEKNHEALKKKDEVAAE